MYRARVTAVIVTALAAVVAATALVAPTAFHIARSWQYSRTVERAEDAVEAWSDPPADEDPDRWRMCVQLLSIAVANVCFSEQACSLNSVQALLVDMEARSAPKPGMDDLCWLWDRLSETGPHGSRYIRQMTPLWDEYSANRCCADEPPETLPSVSRGPPDPSRGDTS